MFFRCKNCGGNVVYSPEKHIMYCPYCDSENSHERSESSVDMALCPNCGGAMPIKEHTSATQCQYCGSYIIFNERVEGKYAPKMVMPFILGKEQCKKAIKEKFKKKIFAPTDFLSEVRLNSIQGTYVPYWMYDYKTDCTFTGEGTKVRKWVTGNTEYTETSYYTIQRDLGIVFEKIPVDASEEMPDQVMDLLEPFDYSKLIAFQPEYMSGFYGEKYNMPAEQLEPRANQKMVEDATEILKSSYAGYNTVREIHKNILPRDCKTMYSLLPVWKYVYSYKGEKYDFYVNGQSGKIIGKAPVSGKKVLAYTGTLFACMAAIVMMLPSLLGLF